MNHSYARKSFIKGIKLELPGYRYRHKPFQQKGNDNFEFVGREENSRQLLDTLLNGSSNGAYLVAGYRGMGKTSFVNSVLKEYGKELKKRRIGQLRAINVSLGKSDVKQEDLLKQLILALQMAVVNPFHRTLLWITRPSHVFHVSFLTYFMFLSALVFKDKLISFFPLPIQFLGDTLFKNVTNDGKAGNYTNMLAAYIVVPAILSFLIGYLFVNFFSVFVKLSPTIRLYNKLTRLYARCSSEISEEENVQSMVKTLNVGFFSKSTTKYPPLSIKEAELQLIDIIRRLDRITRRRENKVMRLSQKIGYWFNKALTLVNYYRENIYVFVFDEMDKIEPGMGGDDFMRDVKEFRTGQDSRTYIDEYRDKKQMMVTILSSLKNLISESNARYIFITGREMFEASLADIADRQNSVGSIFHKIIYVDSFLKDSVGQDPSGLSNVIENYLKRILLPKDFTGKWELANNRSASDEPLLKIYFDLISNPAYLKDVVLSIEDSQKIVYSLQQFIIYLTYRSNGSPKKITRLIEDLIFSDDTESPGSPQKNDQFIKVRFSVQKKKWHYRLMSRFTNPARSSVNNKNCLMLVLSYNNQFRFGFITYLYRPFLLTYSKRIKNYSDYLLVSTTYLVDHILKFHPFAFSTRNLELLPEVLSTNRTPQLRYFIDELLLFLSYSYIRETEISLFEYKFYNKIANEILYLTNLFEHESAAFNFTLDESYSIKIHIRNKILELRKIHKDFKSNEYEYIHSISALNNLLGDVRFFDQEYNDAITAYSDAVQALRSMDKRGKVAKIEIVLLMIQLQLKLGLTYEKIKSYENALAYFTDSMEYTLQTALSYYGPDQQQGNAPVEKTPADTTPNILTRKVSIHEMLEVSIHAFVANLYLMEKMSSLGADLQKIEDTYSLVYPLFAKPGNKTLQVNFLSNLAVMLFYKNLFVQDIQRYDSFNIFNDIARPIFIKTPDTIVSHRSGLVKDFRFPNVALLLNIIALDNLIKYCDTLNPRSSKIAETHIADWMASRVGRAFEMVAIDPLAKISNKDLLKNIAVLLARIADILLTNIESSKDLEFHKIVDKDILEYGQKFKDGSLLLNQVILQVLGKLIPDIREGFSGDLMKRFRLILACYYVSGKYYSLAGKIASCSYQYRRIFRVIASVAIFDQTKSAENKTMLDFMEYYLLHEILKNTSTNSNGTDRVQIRKFKYYFNVSDLHFPSSYTKSAYSNISNNPEVREVILLFAEMKLKTIRIDSSRIAADLSTLLDEQDLVNPYNIISSQWIRLMELRLQSCINRKLKKEYFDPLFISHWPFTAFPKVALPVYWRTKIFRIYASTDGRQLAELRKNTTSSTLIFSPDEQVLQSFFSDLRDLGKDQNRLMLFRQFRDVVINSIHCLSHMIEILQTYGSAYPGGNAFIGDTHRYHVNWMIYYYLVKEAEQLNQNIFGTATSVTDEVESIVGKENFRNTDPLNLAQSAQLFYFRALEIHHEGNAYKTLIQTQNYLDDDFNDSMNHFAAALERQRINSGFIRHHIQQMEQLLQHSQLFRYDSFVNAEHL